MGVHTLHSLSSRLQPSFVKDVILERWNTDFRLQSVIYYSTNFLIIELLKYKDTQKILK